MGAAGAAEVFTQAFVDAADGWPRGATDVNQCYDCAGCPRESRSKVDAKARLNIDYNYIEEASNL